MNILITGATGFLGSRLVEAFVKKERVQEVIATGRKWSSDNRVVSPNVDYILGDLTDVLFVKSLFDKQIDIIINCASLSSPWGSEDAFYQANCVTQQHLIEHAKSHDVKRFIYISSPSIYFDFNDALGINEKTVLPQKMVNTYAKTKVQAEAMLRESGLEFVVLRPRALIGRGDTVIMPRLIRSYKEGKLKILGSGTNKVDLTSVQNMAEATWLAATTDSRNANEDYNISNGEPVNLWESINLVLVKLGYKKVEKKLPYWLLYAIAWILETKAKLFNSDKEPVLTRYSVGVLAKSFSFDITKAKTRLGYMPTQTTNQAIDEFVKWYKP